MSDIQQQMERVYALAGEDDQAAATAVRDVLGELIRDDKFDELNDLMRNLDLNRSSERVMLTVLAFTFPYSRKIPKRKQLFRDVFSLIEKNAPAPIKRALSSLR